MGFESRHPLGDYHHRSELHHQQPDSKGLKTFVSIPIRAYTLISRRTILKSTLRGNTLAARWPGDGLPVRAKTAFTQVPMYIGTFRYTVQLVPRLVLSFVLAINHRWSNLKKSVFSATFHELRKSDPQYPFSYLRLQHLQYDKVNDDSKKALGQSQYESHHCGAGIAVWKPSRIPSPLA